MMMEMLMLAADAWGALEPVRSAITSASIAWASDDEGGSGWLLLAGPASGLAVYWGLYRYYRNTDKSHNFEQETHVESQPITGGDVKVDEVRGTKRTSIPGANGRRFRDRVQRVQ